MTHSTTQTPPVGWRIHYFPDGDRRHPHVADVTEEGLGGQVRVNYQTIHGRELCSSRMFVRHIDDPWAKENPEHIRKFGCWDYIPGASRPQFAPEAAKEAAPEPDRKTQGLERARELFEQGMTAEEIAPKVRAFGLTKSDVEELLTQPVG